MKPTHPPQRTLPSQIQALAARLEQWRAGRAVGQHIPERLWRRAAELARRHGLSATARALKLNYYDLQRRLGGQSHSAPSCSQKALTFVQVAGPQAPVSADHLRATLEVHQPGGTRLVFQWPCSCTQQALALIQTLATERA